MDPRVVACVVGSSNVDLQLAVPRLPKPGETVLATGAGRLPGGKGANQAVALARLGATVRFCSAVGEDGRWLLDHLVAQGVPVAEVAVDAGSPTGLAVVTAEASGENAIVVVTGASAKVVAPEDLAGVDVLLLSLEIPLPTVHRAARTGRAAGVPVVLNAAPAAPLDAGLLALVDVLVVNESEALALGVTTDLASASGAAAVVITRGSEGALVVESTGLTAVPAHPASLVDSTGAGDCFAAALAYGIGRGTDLVQAVELAVVAAALSVEQAGAQTGLPTLAAVLARQPGPV